MTRRAISARPYVEEELNILKTIEIQHCRLAMIAAFGFIVEGANGVGPLDFWP